MSAQNYLKQIKILDTIIKQKEELHKEIYEAATDVGAIKYDKEFVQVGKSHDRIERLTIKYLELEKQIFEKKLKFQILKNRIVDEIQELSDERYINVLYKRYVEYKRYEKIAEEMNYSFDYVKELHKCALEEFAKKYPTKSHFKI